MWTIHVVAAFVLAALSGMGVGGGGLFVIYLTLIGDTPQLTAQGANLLFFLFSAGASMTVHLNRRRIYGAAVLLMAVGGISGALAGTYLTAFVSESLLRKGFGFLLILGGILSLQRRKETARKRKIGE